VLLSHATNDSLSVPKKIAIQPEYEIIMQKTLQITLLLTSCILFSACQTAHQPQTLSPTCKKLRRQYAYNRRTNSVEATWNTKDQHQRLQQLLKEYHCI
jgi:uncharacterized lipoprotein YajG